MIIVSPLAYAQEVPTVIAIAALSPIIMMALAGVLGWLDRSLLTGLKHIALVFLWVAVFLVLSSVVTTDWLICTPLVLYGAHGLWMLGKVVSILVKRRLADNARLL